MTDYISREAAIALAREGRLVSNSNFKSVCDAINSIPAADVRPVVRGKWKRTSKSLMACSVCGNCVVDDRISGLFFCFNCGADMREPPKEET